MHRAHGVGSAVAPGINRNLDDAPIPGRAQPLQIRLLVLNAALFKELRERIVPVRLSRESFGDGARKPGEVHAAEMVREIGRGQTKLFAGELHKRKVWPFFSHRAGGRQPRRSARRDALLRGVRSRKIAL